MLYASRLATTPKRTLILFETFSQAEPPLRLNCLSPLWNMSFTCLFQEHNDVMPNTGIEAATLRSLARRSNQVSYAAARDKQ